MLSVWVLPSYWLERASRNRQCTELRWTAVESKQGCVYCQQCKDFIYDPMLENVRLLQGQCPLAHCSCGKGRSC